MNIFKLALYGDSLACPRQNIVNSHERYIASIDSFLRSRSFDYIEIRDKATGGATITDLYNAYKLDNTYFALPGDILIIHSGIVDCAPRPIKDTLRDKISKLPAFLKKPVIAHIHKNRRKLILKGEKVVRTEKKVFQNTLETFLHDAVVNYKKVFVINICPTNDDTNYRSPGFSESISEYNLVIAQTIEMVNSPRLGLIDIHQFISKQNNIDKYIVKEDGHHIYPSTHKIISELIIEACRNTPSILE